MIQTLPLLLAGPIPVRGPQADQGQADFGQWLAPPPAQPQPAMPPAPPLPDTDTIATVPGLGAIAPAAHVVPCVGPPPPVATTPAAQMAGVSAAPFLGLPALLEPSLPQERVAPVVVHLMSPIPLTPLTLQATHSTVMPTPMAPAALLPLAAPSTPAVPLVASVMATLVAPTPLPTAPQIMPTMLPAQPISSVPPAFAPPSSLSLLASPGATTSPLPSAPLTSPPTTTLPIVPTVSPMPPASFAPAVSLLPPTSPAATASLPAPADVPAPVLPQVSPSSSDSVRSVWTLASRSGGETVDLFFTPWQLVAGHQLSQQWRSRTPGVATPAEAAPGSTSSQLASGVAAMAMNSISARDADWPLQAGTPLTTPWAAAARPAAAAAGAAAEAIASGAPALGAAAAWPLRLLRWLNEGSHGATAWLRDFTLDADALPALVQDLQRFAASQDIPLHRIVLNGRTLWTATPPTATPSNHGETHAS